MEASGCFDPVGIRRHVWDVEYDAEAYLAVLDTYSSHRAMADDARAALYDRIRRRILTRPAGRIRKSYLATLVVGVRR
jgi:hypothetical protein